MGGPTAKPEPEQETALRKTREQLERLGLPDDSAPEPDAVQRGEAPASDGPTQSSVQPAAPALKEVARRQDKR